MSLQIRVAMDSRINKLTLRTAPVTQRGRPHSQKPNRSCNKVRHTHRSVGKHTHTNSSHTFI